MRPLFLLDPPELVEVLAEVPDGPPHRFRWRRRQHRIALAEGPERIAPEWWRSRSGRLDSGHTRDYWRVEDEGGRRFWLFRAGFYGAAAPPRWYMHGLFA
jgi:protein ImuB